MSDKIKEITEKDETGILSVDLDKYKEYILKESRFLINSNLNTKEINDRKTICSLHWDVFYALLKLKNFDDHIKGNCSCQSSLH